MVESRLKESDVSVVCDGGDFGVYRETAGYAGAGMVGDIRLSPGLRREGERGAPLLTEWSAGAIVTRITGQGGIMLHPVHPMNA